MPACPAASPKPQQGPLLTVHQPTSLAEALALRAEAPEALVVAGGTGVVVGLTSRRLRPPALLDLSRVGALHARTPTRLGAMTTYSDVLADDRGSVLGLAARTVAGVQVRNRGTLAGALVLADPSGDALAALSAAGATLTLASSGGDRTVRAEDFVTAPGTCDLRAGELVLAIDVPAAAGPVAYLKAGARNAMARAVCAVAAVRTGDGVRLAVVGAHPRPFVVEDAPAAGLGERVAAQLDPPDDARGSAAFRRHCARVLVDRAVARVVA